jgi:hypothetical protein
VGLLVEDPGVGLNLLLYFTTAYEDMCLKRLWALLIKPDPWSAPLEKVRPEQA